MVFDAGEARAGRRGQIRFDVVEIKVEADVAVKIAVTKIARDNLRCLLQTWRAESKSRPNAAMPFGVKIGAKTP